MDHAKEIQSAIVDKPPFYASTHTIPEDNLLTKFCFFKEGEMRYVDLLNLSKDNVQLLADACDPATFGLDKKDVLDPSYRNALKMDKGNFCTNFELRQKDFGMDIIGEIRSKLWDAADGPAYIRPEIYKLNVYGKDSFFKKHKDTPRGVDMVGSLVVAFPTPECEGGELLVSKDDKSWTWDSAKILEDSPKRAIAYVALYSDIDHEVLPVTKGNRITLTYNLYVGSESDDDDHAGLEDDSESLKTALSNALQDPTFLPKGGYIGFGLHYMYPIDPENTKLRSLVDSLKGSDAMTKRVCDDMGLPAKLRTVYRNVRFEYTGKTADFVHGGILTAYNLNETVMTPLYRRKDVKMVVRIDANGEKCPDEDEEDFKDCYKHPRKVPVLWINEQLGNSEFKTAHICYGNEADIGYVYANIFLMVKIDVPGNRKSKE